MSAFNPFRARAADGPAATTAASATVPDFPDSTFLPPAPPSSDLPAQPESAPPQVSSGYPRQPKTASPGAAKKVSTSSDEQEVDPFDPDSAISDDDENEDYQLSRAPDNRPGNSSGSAPHLALSTDRASITSPSTNSLPREHNAPISPIFNAHDYQTVPQSVNRSDEQTSSEINSNTDPTGRSLKERKPPPPPKNHRGKRISNVSNAGALPEQPPPRPSDRLSNNPLAAENAASRPSGAPNASLVTQSTGEGFQGTPENQLATDSSESLSRSRSQSKRPPTPPQSRRQSQMRRSKSTQSKSSTSRLTISSVDSESNYGSQPPSPGPSTRSLGSSSQDRKRISMPPPSVGSAIECFLQRAS
ncbi:hypothetical protein N7470_004890 [Penicillium chermesinum]|nr:hypothetical protein N7470_004890 [Penicillium chermesinum]